MSPYQYTNMAIKRRFTDLRDMILRTLSTGKKTVNQISSDSGINWRTVDNHLIYLIGKGLVRTVFSSPYVKIFELSEDGQGYVKHLEEEKA
jgi:DNA-binding transcriptional ArsR family regulator